MDSQVVLTWIKTTDKKYKQFIKNRVTEIRQNSNVKDLEYMQGKENITNLASRGWNLNTLEWTKNGLMDQNGYCMIKRHVQQKI